MKLNQKLFARLVSVVALVVGCMLGYAQTNTNIVTIESSAEVSAVTTVIKEKQPALTFWLDQVEPLRKELFGIPLWQYLATVIFVLLAVIATKIFDYLVRVQLKKIAVKTKLRGEDLIIELLRGPVKMLAFVLLLQLGLNLFNYPDWLERWLKKGLYLLVAFSITYMVLKLIDLGASFWRNRTGATADKSFNDLLIPLMSKTAKIFVAIMAVLVTLDNLGFNIRTLLAGASISGLALGLAAQDTVGNLFGAAAVFMDKPFKLGDRVQLNGIDGTVEEIGLRSTRIRNLDGFLITVPNKTMGNATITNISRRPNIKTVMNIGITYDTKAEDVQKAIGILNEVYKAHPLTHDLIISFNNFADSSLNVLVVHWWKGLDFKEYLAGLQELNLTIKRRFDEAGISFAFPSRTIYLRQDDDWRIALPNGEPETSEARRA